MIAKHPQLLMLVILALAPLAACGAEPASRPMSDALPPVLPGEFPSFETPRPTSLGAWERDRAKLRNRLFERLGDLPPLFEPSVKVTSERREPGYTLQQFEFDNRAGAIVCGYLLIPEGLEAPAPAILYHHCHTSHSRVGKEELLEPSFAEHGVKVAPGPALAKQGYIVMCIDAYTFGQRKGRGPGGPKEVGDPEEESFYKLFLWQDRTLWGMIVRDDLLALEALLTHPQVDPKHIAAMGFSMGSTRSWWAAALDERVAATVSVACLTRYQDLIAAKALGQHSIYYFVPGLLADGIDAELVAGLIAPRPHLTLTGDQDRGSPAVGVRTINAFQEHLYGLYHAEHEFRGILYPGVGHAYTDVMWDETRSWLHEKLGARKPETR